MQQANQLGMVIRGHQYRHCKRNGFRSDFSGRLLTVFSSSNYCGTERNATGYAVVLGAQCNTKGELLRRKKEAAKYSAFNIFKITIDERTNEVTRVVY